MKKFLLSLTVVILAFALSACTVFQPKPTPTATSVPPTATNTPVPPTATPEPTATITPTSTPTLAPVKLGAVHEVPAGGFSFRSVDLYHVELYPNGTLMQDLGDEDIILLYGYSSVGDLTNEEGMDWFLWSFADDGVAELEQGESYSILIDSFDGLLVDVTGTMLDESVIGQAFVVTNSEEQAITGLYTAYFEDNEENWRKVRHKFEAIWQSIVFIEFSSYDENACEVSTDATYGYTKDNPIKVAGDWMEGPARERAYLDSLCGPDGEQVSYQRLGSEGHGETILDKYEVTYEGANKMFILYIDMYEFELLMAPVGFKCWVAFPLSELYQE